MNELDGIFEAGEYGYRGEMKARRWHGEFTAKREEMIRASTGKQHVFALIAGTGAGKTCAAGMAASDSLNLQRVRRLVLCVPTTLIAEQSREVFRRCFGIHLAIFDARSHRHGVTSDQQGYIVTYSGVASAPKRHQKIATYEPTLVIFDEIHHLGDNPKEKWGQSAQIAFGAVPEILGLSGTPFRPKGSNIPFFTYVTTANPDALRLVSDHSYSLGEAILDGYCREPDFRFSDDGIVEIRPPGSTRPFTISFKEETSEVNAAQRLSRAVQYGSPIRRTFLRNALADIHAAGRKCVIFLGGDTTGSKDDTPTDDVTTLLPSELAEMGYSTDAYMTITMADKDPSGKLKEFRRSKTAWILGTVNMLSEGADAPEISAEIFLTTWISPLSFIQRIGRAIRYMDKGDPRDCWVYLLHHPAYRDAAKAIKDEIKAESIRREEKEKRDSPNEDGTPRTRTEGRAISGGEITYFVINGEQHPAWLVRKAEEEIARLGVSRAWLSDIIKDLKRRYENGHGDVA